MAIGNTHKKLVKIGRVVPKTLSRTDKHRQTDRHAHHDTPLPYRRRSNNLGILSNGNSSVLLAVASPEVRTRGGGKAGV